MSDQPTTEHADLLAQIAEALALHLNGPASDGRGWYRTAADQADCYARADAVMAAVQPVLDRQAAEIERLRQQAKATTEAMHELDDKAAQAYDDRDEALGRAEQAEKELAGLRALHQQIGDLAT